MVVKEKKNMEMEMERQGVWGWWGRRMCMGSCRERR